MVAKGEYRDREAVEVSVLDALVDRGEEGMTVLELRASVDANIDTIETALTSLKEDGLIEVEDGEDKAVITPAERVVPDREEQQESSVFERLRERLPF